MKTLRLLALSLLLTSCASIVSKSSYAVTIDSEPTGADVTVRNEDGQVVHSGRAPTLLTLKASDGYFSRANYTVDVNLPGYNSTSSQLSAKMDGWFWGNIIFGGLIGMLIVDPLTGAMWKLPERHVVQLNPVSP
jgi:hypothetical protein